MINTKICSVCGEHKSTDQFWSKKSMCIPCAKAKDKVDRDADPAKQRERKLRYYYNISPAQYDIMWQAQAGKCAICGRMEEECGQFAIDHLHSCCSGKRSCGKCLRKLLCSNCNTAIGLMGEDIDRFYQAIEYLQESK